MLANLGPKELDVNIVPEGEVLYSESEFPKPWSVVWSIS
jgi:hypothetical protein